jgi:ketosteroid isomerase-like protein
MRHISTVCLLVASSLFVVGQEKLLTKTDTPSVEQTLMQMERDWNHALLVKDFKALDRIMADDWTGIDFRGMTVTKAESIAELKTGESSNQSVELGELKVRAFGNTAIVIGSDTEKSTYHGKDSSGAYVWMDVFVRRDGRWQAVASESTQIKK